MIMPWSCMGTLSQHAPCLWGWFNKLGIGVHEVEHACRSADSAVQAATRAGFGTVLEY